MTFVTWLSEKGALCIHRLALEEFAETGRGLMATQDLAVDELILEMPRSLVITAQDCKQRFYHRTFSDGLPVWTDFQWLVFFILEESLKKKESSWYMYLETLPNHHLPVSRTLDPYLPRCLKERVQDLRGKIQSDWVLMRPHLSKRVDTQMFLWAWSQVSSRCICLPIPGRVFALIPFFDQLNHSHGVSLNMSMDPKTNAFRLYATQPYRVEEQVFINYGAHDDITLWLHYGFVLVKNTYNAVPVDVYLMQIIREFYAESVKTLKQLHLNEDLWIQHGEPCWRFTCAILALDNSYDTTGFRVNPMTSIRDGLTRHVLVEKTLKLAHADIARCHQKLTTNELNVDAFLSHLLHALLIELKY